MVKLYRHDNCRYVDEEENTKETKTRYFKLEELRVRHEDETHNDYVCPDCEKVVICEKL